MLRRLDEFVAKSKRHNEELVVMLTDLDHLKRINDSYGHPMGDQAIVEHRQSLA